MTWRYIGLGMVCCSILLLVAPPVAAQTISSSQQIVVHASVAPARVIIVDSRQPNHIKELLSNTTDTVVPQVYSDVLNGTQLPFSDALQEQYSALLAAHRGWGAGTLFPSYTSHKAVLAKDKGRNVIENILNGSENTVRGITFIHRTSLRKAE